MVMITENPELPKWGLYLAEFIETGDNILPIPVNIISTENHNIRPQSIQFFDESSNPFPREIRTMVNIRHKCNGCAFKSMRNIAITYVNFVDFEPIGFKKGIPEKYCNRQSDDEEHFGHIFNIMQYFRDSKVVGTLCEYTLQRSSRK
jgi:hypothetical protein